MEGWRARGKVASSEICWQSLFKLLTNHFQSPWVVGQKAGISWQVIEGWILRGIQKPVGKHAGALYGLAKQHLGQEALERVRIR